MQYTNILNKKLYMATSKIKKSAFCYAEISKV